MCVGGEGVGHMGGTTTREVDKQSEVRWKKIHTKRRRAQTNGEFSVLGRTES